MKKQVIMLSVMIASTFTLQGMMMLDFIPQSSMSFNIDCKKDENCPVKSITIKSSRHGSKTFPSNDGRVKLINKYLKLDGSVVLKRIPFYKNHRSDCPSAFCFLIDKKGNYIQDSGNIVFFDFDTEGFVLTTKDNRVFPSGRQVFELGTFTLKK